MLRWMETETESSNLTYSKNYTIHDFQVLQHFCMLTGTVLPSVRFDFYWPPCIRLLFGSLLPLQTQASSNVVEDIDVVVDTSESTLARSLSKDRDISKRMYTLIS